MIDTGGGLDRLHISPQSNPPVPEDGKGKTQPILYSWSSIQAVCFSNYTQWKKTDKAELKPDKTKWRETLFKYLFTCKHVKKVQLLTEQLCKTALGLNHDHNRLYLKQWNIYDIEAKGVFYRAALWLATWGDGSLFHIDVRREVGQGDESMTGISLRSSLKGDTEASGLPADCLHHSV